MPQPHKIFLSPHSDDIAFSCFGSILHPPSPRLDGTLIVTVFSNSSTAAALSGRRTYEDITTIRQTEDKNFASSQGCQFTMLNFSDSALRKEPRGSTQAAFKDCTNHPMFCDVKSAIARLLAPAFGYASIYVPLGILGHIDHRMVRDAARQIAAESDVPGALAGLIYYEDLPYAAFATEHHIKKLAKAVISPTARSYDVSLKDLWGRKRIAVQAYASQVTPFILSTLEEHAASMSRDGLPHSERLWIEDKTSSAPIVDIMAWVTWEAARRVGGYTTLLRHICASPKFRKIVGRTILMGPMYMPIVCPEYDPLEDISSIASNLDCYILYPPRVATAPALSKRLLALLDDLGKRHDVGIFYLRDKDQSHQVDRILFNFTKVLDNRNVYMRTLAPFLRDLKQRMNITASLEIHQHSPINEAISALKEWTGFDLFDNVQTNVWKKTRCDGDPSFYVHKDNDSIHGLLLALPVSECLRGLMDPDERAVLIATDELSLPAAYAAQIARSIYSAENSPIIKTMFYSGDVHPIRNLTTGAVTPDVPLLGIISGFNFEGPIRTLIRLSLQAATLDERQMPLLTRYLLDFEPLRAIGSHTNMRIVQKGWTVDALAATSASVRDEMVFLGRGFASKGEIPIISPGVSIIPCDAESKERCRRKVISYARQVWGFKDLEPDKTIIATQIARAVATKGFVRAVHLVEALAACLSAQPGTKVLFIIVTSWDRQRVNSGDFRIIDDLLKNIGGTAMSTDLVHLKVVNQPRWPQVPEVNDMPTGLTREDLHRATDLSLCLSLYDTFAIAPLEPVSCGAIAVVSTGCGCYRKIHELEGWMQNILIADYTEEWAYEQVVEANGNLQLAMDNLFNITNEEKERLELSTHRRASLRLLELIPKTADQRTQKLETGRQIAAQLNWEDQFSTPFETLLLDMSRVVEANEYRRDNAD